MKEIVFIRHGEAESNVAASEFGIVGSDLPLTERGVRQVHAAASTLGKLAIDGVISAVPSTIYSSPYVRTVETAAIIAGHFAGRTIVKDYRLKEIQKGDWNGMRVADVLPLEDAVSQEHRPDFRPPAGENWFDVADRMEAFVSEQRDSGDDTLVIVSHNHPIEIAIGKMTGHPISQWESRPIDNASISIIRRRGELWHIDDDYYNVTASSDNYYPIR